MISIAHFIAPTNFDETCFFCGHKIAPGTLTEEDANDGFAHAACLEAYEDEQREHVANAEIWHPAYDEEKGGIA